MNEEIKPKELKKAVYIMLWAVLGALFAICIGGLVEFISYLAFSELTLEAVLYGSMIFLGIISGFVIGPYAWKMVYIDGKRGKKYVK
jgi:Na+-translocating ferredoxin:NAD+ oxidoreductase RnfD subunit